MHRHTLRFIHDRDQLDSTMGNYPADSVTEVSVTSMDLVTAWTELLTRLPQDTYQALEKAMKVRA